MDIINLIAVIIGFFMMIGFFVMVSNTTDISKVTRNNNEVLVAIYKILEKQEKERTEERNKSIVKPGESVEL